MFKNFGIGLSSYGKAIGLLFSRGLIWYMIFPILLNVLFLVLGWLGVGSITDFVENWIEGITKIEKDSFVGAEYLTPVSTYISGIASGFVWVLMKFIFFFVFAYFGGYIVVICLSPVFAFLSEKTEEILTGNKYKFNGES